MTFTDPQAPAPHTPSTSDDGLAAKSRPRARGTRHAAVALPIQTRLVPHCGWPTEADALPARRGKRR